MEVVRAKHLNKPIRLEIIVKKLKFAPLNSYSEAHFREVETSMIESHICI